MLLAQELDDWLTEAGDSIVKKAQASGRASLTDYDRAVHDLWLLDTEARNGGVSQFFCNWGREGWNRLVESCRCIKLPAFHEFAVVVAGVIGDVSDPYGAVLTSNLDDVYGRSRSAIVAELRGAETTN
jgi:hypothetical protein